MSRNRWVEEVSRDYERKTPLAPFHVGDEVEVYVRILEGEKERTQVFRGVVIARKGRGTDAMFTVRRVVQGEGVERTFPEHSPRVEKIAVTRRGKVRRAKLYYLRELTGRAAKIQELRGPAEAGTEAAAPAAVAAPAVPVAPSTPSTPSTPAAAKK